MFDLFLQEYRWFLFQVVTVLVRRKDGWFGLVLSRCFGEIVWVGARLLWRSPVWVLLFFGCFLLCFLETSRVVSGTLTVYVLAIFARVFDVLTVSLWNGHSVFTEVGAVLRLNKEI